MSRVVSVTSSLRFDRAPRTGFFTQKCSQMLRQWVVAVLILLGLRRSTSDCLLVTLGRSESSKMIRRLFICSATLIGGLLPTVVMAQVPNFGDPVPGLILNVQLAPSSGGSAGVIHTGALQPGVEAFVDRDL